MSEYSVIAQQVEQYLPKYLSPDQKNQLWSELASFRKGFPYYFSSNRLTDQLLQADGWSGFIAIQFETAEKREVMGVILSNTCDIAPENSRNVPVNIVFSPLISVQKYEALLNRNGKQPASIDSIMKDIRQQKVTSLFYFPGQSGSGDEYLISLDNLYAHPLKHFLEQPKKKLLFRLSQTAFYLFLLKMSIHFTRFQEGVSRFSTY